MAGLIAQTVELLQTYDPITQTIDTFLESKLGVIDEVCSDVCMPGTTTGAFRQWRASRIGCNTCSFTTMRCF